MRHSHTQASVWTPDERATLEGGCRAEPSPLAELLREGSWGRSALSRKGQVALGVRDDGGDTGVAAARSLDSDSPLTEAQALISPSRSIGPQPPPHELSLCVSCRIWWSCSSSRA